MNSDMSDFEKEIKDIWRDLYPDETNEIIKNAALSLGQSFISTAIGFASGGYALAYPEKAMRPSTAGVLAKNGLKFLGGIIGIGFNFFSYGVLSGVLLILDC